MRAQEAEILLQHCVCVCGEHFKINKQEVTRPELQGKTETSTTIQN